jgi:hypothetical protein
MNIFWIEEMQILQDTFVVGNLMQFYEEMDQLHPDGWFESYEDAEYELNILKDETDEN